MARSGWTRAITAVVARPSLWREAISTAARMLPGVDGRRFAKPSSDYMAWRLSTAYGDSGADPDPSDLVEYLEWCRQMSAYSQSEPK